MADATIARRKFLSRASVAGAGVAGAGLAGAAASAGLVSSAAQAENAAPPAPVSSISPPPEPGPPLQYLNEQQHAFGDCGGRYRSFRPTSYRLRAAIAAVWPILTGSWRVRGAVAPRCKHIRFQGAALFFSSSARGGS